MWVWNGIGISGNTFTGVHFKKLCGLTCFNNHLLAWDWAEILSNIDNRGNGSRCIRLLKFEARLFQIILVS